MPYWLRAATAEDAELLLAIYASTRQAELALTPWSAEQKQGFVAMQYRAQQLHYQQHFPEAQCSVVMWSPEGPKRAVGRLWLRANAGLLHVLDISLLPEARGQGLGTRLLRDLCSKAKLQSAQVRISVELNNPARRLYERLGFLADGEPQGLYQRMQWSAAPVHNTEECSL
jgi:ribosomal protein S18 acetylase RimI-like enzyme